MNLRNLLEQFKVGALVITLLLSGCATTKQASTEELKQITPNEGVVVGSFQIKGGGDILGRKQWELLAENIKGANLESSLFSSGSDYAIQASRGS